MDRRTALTPPTLTWVAALAWEAEALARSGHPVRTTGIGLERVRTELGRTPPVGPVVCGGCGGGLDPGLAPGTIVVGTELVAPDGVVHRLDAAASNRLVGAGRRQGLVVVEGRIVTSSRIVDTVEAKRALAASSGASVVDMESSAVAAWAGSVGVPFSVVRVVLDPADEALPPLDFVDGTGAVRPLALATALALRPWLAVELVGLARLRSIAETSLAALATGLRPP